MATLQVARTGPSARLDRLPITSIHRQIMWIVAIVFFFELGDLNTFAFASPAVMKAWNLSVSTISHIVSWTFFGMFLGAVTGGWFSDRIGRKKALLITTAWYSGFSLLNAGVQGTIGLSATRLLTGVGLSAMTVIGMTYVSEIFPAKRRGDYQGWIMTIGLVGIPMTAYVARFTVPIADWGWRLIFVWGAFGLVILAFANRLLESPRWYENQGRFAEADAVIERMESCAREEFGELAPVVETQAAASGGPRRGSYADLLARAYLPRTIMLTTVWIHGLGAHAAGGARIFPGAFARVVVRYDDWRGAGSIDRGADFRSLGAQMVDHDCGAGDCGLRADVRNDFSNCGNCDFWIFSGYVHSDVCPSALCLYAGMLSYSYPQLRLGPGIRNRQAGQRVWPADGRLLVQSLRL